MAVPSGNKKPTKKKVFSLDDFKKKVGIEDVPDKPLSWYKCSPALQKATGLPGFPKGYVSLARGFSNTGKSTSVLEAAVSAQKQGDLPIIIDTENNIGDERLVKMGFDWDLANLKINNEYILREFGKKKDKNRNEAAIEDQADMIHHFLNMQEAGELPYNICFIIDSLGTLDCVRSINAQEKGTSDNNMWNAGAFEHSFKSIINSRIPASRKANKEYTNTLIAVQKIWIDNMGAGVVKHKGGEAFFFGARLIFHHGGIAAHGTKLVGAASKGRDVNYGIETKVNVVKNHIDGELGGISMEGKVVSTPHGFIFPDDVKEYKKEHILYFRKVLGDDTLNPDDILTKYTDVNMDGEEELNVENLNETYNANFRGKDVDLDTGEIKE